MCVVVVVVAMGKSTSTIGIPIKLLNEAQVRSLQLSRIVSIMNANGFLIGRAMSLPLRSPRASSIEESFWRVRFFLAPLTTPTHPSSITIQPG